jgi:hypothetical protein
VDDGLPANPSIDKGGHETAQELHAISDCELQMLPQAVDLPSDNAVETTRTAPTTNREVVVPCIVESRWKTESKLGAVLQQL